MEGLRLDSLLEQSEVAVVGIDGGGLDDMFGFAVVGRHKETRDWLVWSHAWCHEGVLDRRVRRRMIVGGRRSLRRILFQAALAAARHNPVLKPFAKRLEERGKPHKLIIIAVARRLVAIANAVLKAATPWQSAHPD